MALATSSQPLDPDKGLPFPQSVTGVSSDKSVTTGSQNRAATRQYRRDQVETANPTRLVVMLYDGAIRFCMVGLDAMRKGDLESQNTHLIKAQRILGELMSSLNRAGGGEIAVNLFDVYAHLMEELVKANLYAQAEPLEHVLKMLRELRESWQALDRAVSQAEGSVKTEVQESSNPAAMSVPCSASVGGAKPMQNRKSKIENHGGAPLPPSRLGDRRA